MPMTHESRKLALDNKQVFISCIVPVHNEEEGIALFVQALEEKIATLTSRYEILLIDDGSRDKSALIIENTLLNGHIKFIRFSRNFGKENALTAGLEYCQGEVAVLIDADFQHPFEVIDQFLESWAKGYDMAYGVRRDRQDESPGKRWFANQFYKLMGHLSEVRIPPDAGDFRLLDRKVINALRECKEYSRFMKGLYAWVGFSSVAIPYTVKARQTGKSSWSFFKLFDLALTGIISFSDAPLRVWSLVGMTISSIAFLYALWIVFKTLFFGIDVKGYATLVVAIMFFGGIQLISIGILGEYLARIFREVKKRPPYIISKTSGISKE